MQIDRHHRTPDRRAEVRQNRPFGGLAVRVCSSQSQWNPVSNALLAGSGIRPPSTSPPDGARAMWKIARCVANRIYCEWTTMLPARNSRYRRSWSECAGNYFGATSGNKSASKSRAFWLPSQAYPIRNSLACSSVGVLSWGAAYVFLTVFVSALTAVTLHCETGVWQNPCQTEHDS